LHPHKKCVVNQREVGVDTRSFKNALRAALREDPDVILVGEMRDNETDSPSHHRSGNRTPCVWNFAHQLGGGIG
jgi:Tfp pilus assembly ATPase PilU